MNATKLYGILALALPLASAACNKDVTFAGGNADGNPPKVVADQEFPAALIGSEAIKVNVDYGLVTQQLALAEKPPVVMTMKQTERALAVDPFIQGRDGAVGDEKFDVASIGKLDLLIVVDNSDSMEDEQAKLKTELASLTDKLTSVDWQIAVITTDSSCIINNRIIKKSDADAPTIFKDLIEGIGHSGLPTERGIHFALQALKGVCEDKFGIIGAPYKFLRDDASFGLLVLSDEESYCPAGGCDAGDRPEDLVAALSALKADKERVRAYAFLWNDPTVANGCVFTGNESKGTRYESVVNGIGGLTGSICAADYGSKLKQISDDVKDIVRKEFVLKVEPEAKSLKLKMLGKNETDCATQGNKFTDFNLDGRMVRLTKVSNSDSKLCVSYTYDSKPKFDRFKLSSKPILKSLQAWIDGKQIDPSKLSFDDQSGELVFADMPGDNADIKVKFRKGDEPLGRMFDAPWTDMDGTPVAVTVNGTAVANAHFDAETKVLAFDEAPEDGAEIKVAYKRIGRQIAQYAAQLRTDAELRHDVVAVDATTGEPVPVALAGDQLVFDASAVYDGRAVNVTYDYGSAGDMLEHQLAHLPLDGSVVVTADGADGEDCVDHVGILGQAVSFSCTSQQISNVSISYKYVAERYNRFTVADVPEGATRWKVFVDGASVTFAREGNTVIVDPAKLTLDSKVRVMVDMP